MSGAPSEGYTIILFTVFDTSIAIGLRLFTDVQQRQARPDQARPAPGLSLQELPR